MDRHGARFFDASGQPVVREPKRSQLTGASIGKGTFRHHMEKELLGHLKPLPSSVTGNLPAQRNDRKQGILIHQLRMKALSRLVAKRTSEAHIDLSFFECGLLLGRARHSDDVDGFPAMGVFG